MTCKEAIIEQLSELPYSWREQLANVICNSISTEVKCSEVKDCETLTFLSEFTVNGNTVSITYTDENEESHTKSFNFEEVLSLDNVDPKCLTTVNTWKSLDYVSQMQTIVNKLCSECGEVDEVTTTTTTTTTVAPTTTTTTTTEVPTTTSTTTTTTEGTTSTTSTTTVVETTSTTTTTTVPDTTSTTTTTTLEETTSTTTTTTASEVLCREYTITNNSFDTNDLAYESCDGTPNYFPEYLANGSSETVCARVGTVVSTGSDIVEGDECN